MFGAPRLTNRHLAETFDSRVKFIAHVRWCTVKGCFESKQPMISCQNERGTSHGHDICVNHNIG